MRIVGNEDSARGEVELTPAEIVAELDKYIIGQDRAKRTVAIAIRNRYRRARVEGQMRDEIIPKNILMIGPTGVGKTEVARRMARQIRAPFVKIEATKFTEVGYVGRDVDSIVRDLAEVAVRALKNELMAELSEKLAVAAAWRIVDILQPKPKRAHPAVGTEDIEAARERSEQSERIRAKLHERILSGAMDDEKIRIQVSESQPKFMQVFSSQGLEELGMNLQEMLGDVGPKSRKEKEVSVAEARRIFLEEEVESELDHEKIVHKAIERVEQTGIVFIDEIDKITLGDKGAGPDVSRGGVQRDLLPLVEGTTVITKYGPIKTNHILFMAAGAFSTAKPSDLIPEFQGRFPLRVEFDSLSAGEFERILTEPKNALTRQYQELLATDRVVLKFTSGGVKALARLAQKANRLLEDIGARRLYTMMEKVLEDVSFDAPFPKPVTVKVDRKYVEGRVGDILAEKDLAEYIL
jgi:ATP-dependent HslUV protease ATP-binding subunit HslU